MTQKELNKIIENHQYWLNRDCDGWKEMRANLSGEYLKNSELVGANLNKSILSEAYLKY